MIEQQVNGFWEFSVAFYAKKGVTGVCLELQDNFGFDVNTVLYACWLAHLRLQLSSDHLAGLEAHIADWRRQVVLPLRQLRQQWRELAQAADLRRTLKDIELQAERRQQDMMYAYFNTAPTLPGADLSVRDNLGVVAAMSAAASSAQASVFDRLVLLYTTENSG